MSSLIKAHSRKKGLPPGTLLHIGLEKKGNSKATLINYSASDMMEKPGCYVDEFLRKVPDETVTWLNIEGIHDVDVIRVIGEHLNIHMLTLEDVVHSGQRPKFEDFNDYLYIVLKMLRYNHESNMVESQQVSMILGKGYLMTFEEETWDVFETIRQRLRKSQGTIRQRGCDYLTYCLIDTIVDHYFEILEHFGDQIEVLEEELLTAPSEKTLHRIHIMKRNFVLLRKSIWPLREVIQSLHTDDSELLTENTQLFLRDVLDHTIQVLDTLESSRDMVAGMLEIYLSSVSNRMNRVMKVLTVIATIFIPLSFITGIFGMNFKSMPELNYAWMYPWGFWLLIGLLVGGMVYFFRKQKWL